MLLSQPEDEERFFMRKTVTLAPLAVAGSLSIAAFAADREIKVDDRLDASADTLHDMMNASDHSIPHDLLDKAKVCRNQSPA